MYRKTLTEISKDLVAKQYSAVELTKHYLQRIKDFDPKLNSFITVTDEIALKQAAEADKRLAKNEATPLTGIPISYKDLFCTKGVKTSCASKMLANFIAPYDATAVEKLQTAGMVMLGKNNMDEFAMGASNENSYYGAVHNPWNLEMVTGGSSGGSTASVAARISPVSLGTDTGGSIRQPAAFCGITGLKPTYGRVSRFGMVAFVSSMDQAGILAQNAEDTALVLNYLAGFDHRDSTSTALAVPDYTSTLKNSLNGLRIGLPKEFFNHDLASGIAETLDKAIQELRKLGAEFKEVSLPNCKLAIPVYYIIAPAECSSNLARFDGVRYGYRCENPINLDDLYMRSRGEGFGLEVKRRILTGAYVLSAGFYDAYYLKAQKIRRLIKNDFDKVLQEVDVILGPTTPSTAFKIGSKVENAVEMYLSDIYTCPVNLAGLPSLSIPAGFLNNLPVGMQLIGNYFAEEKLLNIAHQYQGVTDWHRQTPKLLMTND
jgi:aspartyl-tRNA(Asn)/glutamyl-tRNA(Gln) amidotransferase subunit A